VLYEMLTGHPPFSGKSSVEVLGKQVREAVMPTRQRAPERKIPEVLEKVVMRAMSKRREDRFSSAVSMRRAMEAALEGDVVTKDSPKKRSFVARGAVLAAVIGAIAIISHAGTRAAPTPSAAPAETVAHVDEMPAAATNAPDPTPLALQAPFVPPSTTTDPTASGDNPPKKHDKKNDRLETARAAAHEHPGDPKALRAWANAAMKAGDYRDARRAVDTWILHDSSPEPRVLLASVLDQSGKHAEARAVLEEILQTHPDNGDARKLHAKLGAPLAPPDTSARRGQVARNEK
jgi:serine/threonine-protein kinase